jgi:hypothetical protein
MISPAPLAKDEFGISTFHRREIPKGTGQGIVVGKTVLYIMTSLIVMVKKAAVHHINTGYATVTTIGTWYTGNIRDIFQTYLLDGLTGT